MTQLLNAHQLADHLGLKHHTIYRWRGKGWVRPYGKENGVLVFDLEEVLRGIEDRKTQLRPVQDSPGGEVPMDHEAVQWFAHLVRARRDNNLENAVRALTSLRSFGYVIELTPMPATRVSRPFSHPPDVQVASEIAGK